jgi:hypothetical protein
MPLRTKTNHHRQGTDTNGGKQERRATSSHRPFSKSNLDGGAVDWSRAIVPLVAVGSPRSVRGFRVLGVVGLLAVLLRFWTPWVISLGMLGLSVVAVRLLRLATIGRLVLVFGNIVLVAFAVVLTPRALFAGLLAHRDRVAEAVEGALLFLTTEEHEVAGLSWF